MSADSDLLLVQLQQVRASGVLGQGRALQLFDYLARCTASGRTPKEAEVAVEVFGKQATADLSQDASVRVYVHNLRRRLDQYYGDAGRTEPWMLTLPKGDYRLVLQPNPLRSPQSLAEESSGPVAAAFPGQSAARPRRTAWYVAGALILGLCLGFAGAWFVRKPPASPLAAVRRSAFWAPMLDDGRPVLLVVGDYYIFGDTGGDNSMNVTRLIRDFNINSRTDLENYLMSNPGDAERFQDVGLGYLPTSSAYALSGLLPVLAPVRSRLRVMLASDLNPMMLKSSDVIYVGLLSGMGLLHGGTFHASRFQPGDSFDELIDRVTHHHYISQAVDYADDHFNGGQGAVYFDYGYLSSFTGPTGNRIIVIAGMQDEGLRQTVDFAGDAASLTQLTRQAPGQKDMEGLLEVSAMNHLNLSGRLLFGSALTKSTR